MLLCKSTLKFTWRARSIEAGQQSTRQVRWQYDALVSARRGRTECANRRSGGTNPPLRHFIPHRHPGAPCCPLGWAHRPHAPSRYRAMPPCRSPVSCRRRAGTALAMQCHSFLQLYLNVTILARSHPTLFYRDYYFIVRATLRIYSLTDKKIIKPNQIQNDWINLEENNILFNT